MNVWGRLLCGVMVASLLAWPVLLGGASCCVPSPGCSMSCCLASHTMQADPACPAASDKTITCDCGHGADSWSLSALPKIILGDTSLLSAPVDCGSSVEWRDSDELAGYLYVPSPPPLSL